MSQSTISHSVFPDAAACSEQEILRMPARLAAALLAMRQGRPVLLTDDDDREDEADLIIAAERLSEATMALLIRECSGIVCLCLQGRRSSA